MIDTHVSASWESYVVSMVSTFKEVAIKQEWINDLYKKTYEHLYVVKLGIWNIACFLYLMNIFSSTFF